MKNTIVIYHHNCVDGIGAAYCAYKVFGDNAEFIPGKYDSLPEISYFLNKDVYLLDFSFKRETFLELQRIAKSVTVLDHHKTAHEEIGDLVHIDQTKSGARLAFEYFSNFKTSKESVLTQDFGNSEKLKRFESICNHIQDRDLWKFELPNTKEITSALFENVNLSIKEFVDFIDNNTTETLLKRGTILTETFNKELQEHIKNAEVKDFKGFIVPVLNAPLKFASDAGNILSQGYPFAVVWEAEITDSETKIKYSLRSQENTPENPDAIDVSLVAKKFGGGGHQCAAGFFEVLENDKTI